MDCRATWAYLLLFSKAPHATAHAKSTRWVKTRNFLKPPSKSLLHRIRDLPRPPRGVPRQSTPSRSPDPPINRCSRSRCQRCRASEPHHLTSRSNDAYEPRRWPTTMDLGAGRVTRTPHRSNLFRRRMVWCHSPIKSRRLS